MAGTVTTNSIVISENSSNLDQFTDVIVTSSTHLNTIMYDSTNWVNTEMSIKDLSDISITTDTHDEVLIWNSVTSSWENGKISDLLTELEGVVTGIISIKLSVFIGEGGDSAKSLSVAFTDAGESTFTMSMTSCGDNNAIYKKSPTDTVFSYFNTLDKGEILNTDLVAGTVFRSDKGISGFSTPFPIPFGVSCLADTYFRFYALRNSVFVYVTSAGRASLVTLYASDETTIVDGPTLISAYGSTTLACNANTEFVVTATTEVFAGTSASLTTDSSAALQDTRLLPPMDVELLAHNRLNRVTAQFAGTTVTWHKRDMTIGSVTVEAGTPFRIGNVANAGSDQNFLSDGWLILRSDKPISSFAGADGAGSNAVSAWPTSKLAQLFPILSTIGTNVNFDQAGINIVSPYEGTARVYDSTGAIQDTFTYTRGTSPATTPAEQLFPAAGQSNPNSGGLYSYNRGMG